LSGEQQENARKSGKCKEGKNISANGKTAIE